MPAQRRSHVPELDFSHARLPTVITTSAKQLPTCTWAVFAKVIEQALTRLLAEQLTADTDPLREKRIYVLMHGVSP